MRLTNKAVMVVGDGAGISRAVALKATCSAAGLVVVGPRPEPLLETVAMIRDQGCGPGSWFQADPAVPGDAARALAHVLKTYGRIDALIQVVGGGGAPPEAEEDLAWAALFDGALKGAWHMARAVAESMGAQGFGSIVSVADAAAVAGSPFGRPPYVAARAGLGALTRTLALEWGPLGVRVNCVYPGPIASPQLVAAAEAAARREGREGRPGRQDLSDWLTRTVPLGRAGRPEEVAQAAIFLAADESSFITGAILPVDGGYTVR